MPRLVERFYRGREVSTEGSGLAVGLDWPSSSASLNCTRLALRMCFSSFGQAPANRIRVSLASPRGFEPRYLP
ncbi:MAG: hypothetical protein V5B39_00890 [Accumulibacter sp.]|uniref:hypothetical protein n=1 Tax=Accumulibacter sp. TaxID=2053492 RepID=UPI002FC38DE4